MPADRREFAAVLQDLGIGRTSATVPPLGEQLRQAGELRMRTLVLNLLPTQPEFALPAALTRLAMEDVRAGLGAIQGVVKARRVMVVVDRHDRFVRRAWKRAGRAEGKDGAGVGLTVIGLLNKYPQGHPTVLLRTLFGTRLGVDALPPRVGRVIVDPVACWGLGRWLRTGQAMDERPVQLFVEGAADARLVMGRPGETVAAFCERYGVDTAVPPPSPPNGGMPGGRRQVIVNGMLAGEEVDPAGAVIETWTESVAVRPAAAPEPAAACIACGWCVDVCPTALTPVRLLELGRRIPTGVEVAHGATAKRGGAVVALLKSREARESLHCIGCGLCSYVCPTRLPLTQETVRLRVRVAAAGGRSVGERARGDGPE
jgi:electron transport complex protein RnfC